ncbi:hypothetical protein F2Q69_00030306 [Brassica cretica]|uniref:Arabidopsis retrotransposon Orf1 C-terminal domain-containing protein n=1 Tax=Brassica cretica TaxID=69181 RepID=A0A8S9S746_BRACR|nr:hypothetical protein F2Q69_00030306 [Brassica cretica]
MITPLLQFLNVPLGKDAAGPKFIDGTYLRIATYFSGMYGKDYVYHYYLQGKPVEVVLPNQRLTSLERHGAISFNLSQEDFLGEHGSLGPIAAPRKRSAPTRHDFTEPPREESVPIYGPPHYYFKPHDGVLPPGALRDAHDYIGRLQRWNKAQDRTIKKLKDKCKALSKMVKKQAKTSAKFMKKVADVLTRGGIAGCSPADFAFANTSVPLPPPQPTDLGFPLTGRQLQRKWRNPPTQPSASGNKSPSLASSESEAEIEEVQSQQLYGDSSSGHGDKRLARLWNKEQDRTIEKLKDKCKALSKTVKNQAKTSAKFMKKVADVLTRGGIAGCSSADFAFANTSVPQPPPQPTDLGFPLTDR